MRPSEPETLADWLQTRSAAVQDLARRFPLDAEYRLDGRVYYLLGFAKRAGSDTPAALVLTPINPGRNYTAAMQNRVYVCIDALEPAAAVRLH
jgi:hypothetical protein